MKRLLTLILLPLALPGGVPVASAWERDAIRRVLSECVPGDFSIQC